MKSDNEKAHGVLESELPYRTCRRSAYRIALAGEAHTVSHLQEKRIPYRLAGEAYTVSTCRRSAYSCRNPDEIMSGGNCNCVLGERSERNLITSVI